jgi:DNA invertase Pin-like site-specific DNA recombinase
MTTAYSYIRFSGTRQKKGDSKRRQLEWSHNICASKGWTLDESLKLDSGVSAFRGKNATSGALAAFLSEIKAGKVKAGSVLLLESLDRLSRQEIDAGWELFRSILKTGVEIYTRTPEHHYVKADLNDFGTRIEVQAYFLRAFNESETKMLRSAEYWKFARKQMAEKDWKIHKVIPAWLTMTDDYKFKVRPEGAKAIQRIFTWAAKGFGLDAITKRLNQEGFKTITARINKEGEAHQGRRTSWGRSYVAKILDDHSVLGEYQPHVMAEVPDPDKPDATKWKRVPHGAPVKDYFPRIVTENEFYAARSAMKERNKRAAGRPNKNGVCNLFTGLIKDARDGEVMHLTYANSAKGVNNARRLVSSAAKNYVKGSVRMEFPYDVVERAFLEAVKELKVKDVLGDQVDDAELDIAALTAKLDELDAKIAKIQERVANEAGIDALLTLLEKLDREKKTVAAELEQAKTATAGSTPEALHDAQSLIEVLENAPEAKRPELRERIKNRIRQLVSEMWLLPWNVTDELRAAELQVVLKSGKIWSFGFGWLRRFGGPFEARGVVTYFGVVLHPSGKPTEKQLVAWRKACMENMGMEAKPTANPIPRLSDYRTEKTVKRHFDERCKASKSSRQALIDAEIKVRKAVRDLDDWERRHKGQAQPA